MSLESTDYITDLLQELDKHYQNIRLECSAGSAYLDELGSGAFEVLAREIDAVEHPEIHMNTPLPEVYAVSIRLKEQDDGPPWAVSLGHGGKRDELLISDIVGRLKQLYPGDAS